MNISFHPDQSLHDFQALIDKIYGLPDDRLYSLTDLLTQQQRFTMRALKGVRKGDLQKNTLNLLIAFSWAMGTANRMHIDLESVILRRFPGVCSYCAKQPCVCKATKPATRTPAKPNPGYKQLSMTDMQAMFEKIYPAKQRTVAEAGIHLAEEMGEVTEAAHNYLGEHQQKLFNEIAFEMADYVSCLFGLANSAGISVSHELAQLYSHNCHVCHKAPCECSFSSIARLTT